jgi:hypothetical protein
MSPPTIASMLKLGTSWFTGQGCKEHAIKRARDLGHSVILGWTHPQGARYYGSYSATTDMLEHCSDPSTPRCMTVTPCISLHLGTQGSLTACSFNPY